MEESRLFTRSISRREPEISDPLKLWGKAETTRLCSSTSTEGQKHSFRVKEINSPYEKSYFSNA